MQGAIILWWISTEESNKAGVRINLSFILQHFEPLFCISFHNCVFCVCHLSFLAITNPNTLPLSSVVRIVLSENNGDINEYERVSSFSCEFGEPLGLVTWRQTLIPANHSCRLGLGITSCRPVALLTIALQIKACKYFIEELMFLQHWRSGHWPVSVGARCLLDCLRTDSDSVEVLMGEWLVEEL